MANRLFLPRFATVLLVILGLETVIGCGDGRPARIAVTGSVTYKGKPLDGASVTFVPKGARPASGQTDAQGRFTLQTFSAGDGVIAGDHVVCIVKSMPDPKETRKTPYAKMVAVTPARYATPVQSPLKATVAAKGTNDFHFELVD